MKVVKTDKILDTLLFLLLVLSGGGLLFVYFKKPASAILCLLALFVCFFFGRNINKNLFYSGVFSLVTFFTIILFTYFVSPLSQSFIKYGFYLLNVVSCIIIYIHIFNNRNYSYFLNRLRIVLRWILYISLANFLFGIIVGYDSIQSLPVWVGEFHEVQHFNYLFFYDPEKHKYTIFGLDLIRNQGWFWEPGINQIYLNTLLYLEGFVFKTKKRWRIILIVVAIITTFSTSGFLIMTIILSSLYINSIVKYITKGNPIIVLALSISVLLPSYYIAREVIIPNIIYKTTGHAESSFQKRLFDLIQCPCIAADYPFTGLGLDVIAFQQFRSEYQMSDNCQGVSDYFQDLTGLELKTSSTEKGSSNSITGLMAMIGFPLSFILFLALFYQTLFTVRKPVFMSIIFISVFFEPILLRPFFMILIISGMMSFFSKFSK